MTMSENNELVVSSGPSGNLHETPMAIEAGVMFGLDPKQVVKVIQTQLIKVPKGDKPATAGELVVVMSTCVKYGLDPMMRQLYAWRDNRGDLACMLSMDGWVELARRNPGYVKVSYKYGPDVPKTGKHKACWEWVQATVHTTDRGDIELPPLYLEEWRKDYGQWLEMPRHKMHVIAYRMSIREVYGISIDVRDPDDVQDEYRKAEFRTVDKVESMAAALPELDEAKRRFDERHADALEAHALSAVEGVNPEQPTSDAPEMGGVLPMSTQPLVEGVVPGPDSFPAPSGIDDPELRKEIINAVKESCKPLPTIDAPCGFKGCSGMAVARCGECGEWVCSEHLGANGFSCVKHEGGS